MFRYNVTVGGQTQVREIEHAGAGGAERADRRPSIRPLAAVLEQIRTAAGRPARSPIWPNPLNAAVLLSELGHRRAARADRPGRHERLTNNHRLTGTYYWQSFLTNPGHPQQQRRAIPGLREYRARQSSYRTAGSASLRSTLSSEHRQRAADRLAVGAAGCSRATSTSSMFDDLGGFAYNWGNNNMFGLTSPGGLTQPEDRNTTNWNIDNTLNWLRGSHSMTFGGSFTQFNHARTISNVVPTIIFGTDANNDPAAGLFNTTNFPGASTTNLTERAAALWPAHRQDHPDHRLRAAERRHESVRVSRSAHRTRPHERARPLRAGLVARVPDVHAELRRAVGAAAADAAAERLVLDRPASRISAGSRALAMASAAGTATCSSPER